MLFHVENSSVIHDAGLLAFRLYIGLSMAFAHGLGKIPPSGQFLGGVSAMGFPAPELFAWLAALSEFLGGLFIALGLATRFSSLALGSTMVVAGFIAHAADPFGVKERAFLFLFSCVLLFCVGAGRFSVDRLISKK